MSDFVKELFEAVYCNHNTKVTELLRRGVSVNYKRGQDGYTLLHKAAEQGNVEVTDLLIGNGAVINAPDNVGDTPLHKATNSYHDIGDMDESVILIAPKTKSDRPLTITSYTYSMSCFRGDMVMMVESLVRSGAKLSVSNNKGATPLHNAAVRETAKVADLLIRNNADVNASDKDGATPLHKAAEQDQVKIADLLIRNSAYVNASDNVGNTPLHQATRRRLNNNMVQTLVGLGANVLAVNMEGKTPLHMAAAYGHVEITDILIRNNAKVNATDNKGTTPLHEAAAHGNVKITEILISNNAEVNAIDSNGDSSLHQAAGGGHDQAVQALVRLGANISAVNNEGDSSLHQAAGKGHDKAVQALVRLGANISAVNNEGLVPLHQAVIYANEAVVETLVHLGANPADRNNEGKSPYDIAEHCLKQRKTNMHSYKYRIISTFLKENYTLNKSIKSSRVIRKKQTSSTDTSAVLTTIQPEKTKGNDIQLPWLVDAAIFQRMLSQGTFISYEHRLSLGGPCKAGKSTLASVLLGEEIPQNWDSTDGLVIHFGRNGIDIDEEKMVPLKEGDRGLAVIVNALRGKPDVSKNHLFKTNSTNICSEIKKNIVDSQPLIRDTNGSPTNTNVTQHFVTKYATSSAMTQSVLESTDPSTSHIYVSSTIDEIETLEITSLQLQSNILEEVKNGKYKIKIAPSDLIDFGGQKSYDMTHQLFIQHSGSFLLMFDGRYGLHNQLDDYPKGFTAASILTHWVDSISTYTDDIKDSMPMILFAATHRDKCKKDPAQLKKTFLGEINQMFSQYTNNSHIHLDEVYFINGIDENDVEIERMTQQVVRFAMKQSSWGQRRPMQWVPLELQITNMRIRKISIITKDDLRKVNQLNIDLTLEDDQLNDFLLVQHSLGKLMYYNRLGLDNFVIIDPPALVNILRSFVTDEQFFPADQNLKIILQDLTETGHIFKTDLLQLWQQDTFRQYMPNDTVKEFFIKLLIHLDILVIPKASKKQNVYLVPCMIKAIPPPQFNSLGNKEQRTLCLRYLLKRNSIPTALAYRIIGASINAWPLKYKDLKPCLYHKAAVLNVSENNELRIWIENNQVKVFLTNELSLTHISPDVAASVQECLTKNLETSLLFHYNSFGKKIKPALISELYTIEVGIPCGNDVSFTSLQEVIKQDQWICGKDKYLRYWFFNKNQEKCEDWCKGLTQDDLKTEPNEKHLARLASTFGMDSFKVFYEKLGMDIQSFDDIEYDNKDHGSYGIRSIALIRWKTWLSTKKKPTLNDLYNALDASNDTHRLCQVFREKLSEDSYINYPDTPTDSALHQLSHQLGREVFQLGIELGLNLTEIEQSVYNFPKDLQRVNEEILLRWKNKSKVKTTSCLMMAIRRLKNGGKTFLEEMVKSPDMFEKTPYFRKMHLEQNVQIGVPSEKNYEGEMQEIYEKKKDQRGLALIVNYNEQREGSEVDVKRLTHFFKNIVNYHVEIVEDKIKSELVQKFESYRENEMTGKSSEKYHCFVLAMMCHGEKDILSLKTKNNEDETVETQDVIKKFNHRDFSGKPKLFMFQACRGEQKKQSIEADDQKKWHPDKDVLISFATTPGYPAYRHTKDGSWFISEFVNAFEKMYNKKDVLSILEEVRRKVYESKYNTEKVQVTQDHTTLYKKFFL